MRRGNSEFRLAAYNEFNLLPLSGTGAVYKPQKQIGSIRDLRIGLRGGCGPFLEGINGCTDEIGHVDAYTAP